MSLAANIPSIYIKDLISNITHLSVTSSLSYCKKLSPENVGMLIGSTTPVNYN